MAIQSSRQPPDVASTVGFSPGGLKHRPLYPHIPTPAPVPQKSFVVAADTVAFNVPPLQTITVTFPNLPNRSTTNPVDMLHAQQNPVPVRVGSTMHFAVSLQNVQGGAPSIAPIAIDVKNVRVPGPFLGGGSSYKVFQATITAGATACSGNIVGTLTLMVAGGGTRSPE